MIAATRPIFAVLEREVIKLLRQRWRLLSSMVRPMLWLLVIGAGFAAMQGRSGVGDYQAFLVPGVLGMTLLFGAMLAALSTVYDKESGVMRMLVIAPIEHYWIAVAKALGAMLSALIQGLMLFVLLAALGYVSSQLSIVPLVLGLLGTALVCASLGILVAAWSRTLDNYASMMNLVIFPVFFLSGSLYPVQQLPEPSADRRDAEPLYVRRRSAEARSHCQSCGRLSSGFRDRSRPHRNHWIQRSCAGRRRHPILARRGQRTAGPSTGSQAE